MLDAKQGRELAGAPALRSGALIGKRYALRKLVSRGPGQATFMATDEHLAKPVIVRCTVHAAQAWRFEQLGKLHHPSIVAAWDRGTAGRWHFAVTEVPGGQKLDSVCARMAHGRPTVDELVRMLLDALDALEHAHQHDVVHGSLALDSLRLDGLVRFVDFGHDPTAPLSPHATLFASPERLRTEPIDARSDLYSLAAVFFTVANGEPPFGSRPELAEDGHLYQHLPPRRWLPEPVDHVLRKAMSKRPADRWASAAQMRGALFDAWASLKAPRPAPIDTSDFEEITNPTQPFDDISVPRGDEEETVRMEAIAGLETFTLEPAPQRTSRNAPSAVLTGMAMATAASAALVAAAFTATLVAFALYLSEAGQNDAVAAMQAPDLTHTMAVAHTEGDAMVVEPWSIDELVLALHSAAARSVGPRGAKAVGAAQLLPVDFGFDSWRPQLDPAFVRVAHSLPANATIVLTGHTDSVGSTAVNDTVGRYRAEAVERELRAQGFQGRIEVQTAGERLPIAPNGRSDGRARNRRVTFSLR